VVSDLSDAFVQQLFSETHGPRQFRWLLAAA